METTMALGKNPMVTGKSEMGASTYYAFLKPNTSLSRIMQTF